MFKQGLIKVLRKYKIINSLNISERRATCVFVSMLINNDNLPSEVVIKKIQQKAKKTTRLSFISTESSGQIIQEEGCLMQYLASRLRSDVTIDIQPARLQRRSVCYRWPRTTMALLCRSTGLLLKHSKLLPTALAATRQCSSGNRIHVSVKRMAYFQCHSRVLLWLGTCVSCLR